MHNLYYYVLLLCSHECFRDLATEMLRAQTQISVSNICSKIGSMPNRTEEPVAIHVSDGFVWILFYWTKPQFEIKSF